MTGLDWVAWVGIELALGLGGAFCFWRWLLIRRPLFKDARDPLVYMATELREGGNGLYCQRRHHKVCGRFSVFWSDGLAHAIICWLVMLGFLAGLIVQLVRDAQVA